MLFDALFSIVWDICWWFYDVSYDIYDVPSVGPTLSEIFLWIHDRFYDWCDVVSDLADWEYVIEDAISSILSEVDILALLRDWLDWAQWAWEWIQDVWYYVTDIVSEWWQLEDNPIRLFIDALGEALQAAINAVSLALSSLQAAWDDFKGRIPTIDEVIAWFGNWWAQILTPLTAWWNERLVEVNTLVNDIIKEWFPFYDDLVSIWGEIQAFFTDPLEFVWQKFTDWFLGPEE